MIIKPIHQIAYDWAVRCFGIDHVQNRQVRALRLVEEAVELCQAVGVQEVMVGQVTKNVYQRPPGDVYQELGGVMMTATVFALSTGVDPDQAFLDELRRVLNKSVENFAKRNREKIMGDVE